MTTCIAYITSPIAHVTHLLYIFKYMYDIPTLIYPVPPQPKPEPQPEPEPEPGPDPHLTHSMFNGMVWYGMVWDGMGGFTRLGHSKKKSK